MNKWVYDFAEADASMKGLLGGKGANLAEMTAMGLPVPPGFTVTTDACKAVMKSDGALPEDLTEQVMEHLEALEARIGRRFGDRTDPLLVSVRSGAPVSMPGMMDTILNIGLTDMTVGGLAAAIGSERYAWDSYRRLVQMYAPAVMGVNADLLAVDLDPGRTDHQLKAVVEKLKRTISAESSQPFPQNPRAQLIHAIAAVFRSWNNERACQYRRRNHIPDSLGTAVTIQAMVFGNRGARSGTGVAFTRNPLTGERRPFCDYLPDAQGEDVVSGTSCPLALEELTTREPEAWRKLAEHMSTLEARLRDMCDIEFTIEDGRLWLLQCRIAKRSAVAEWVVAHDMVDEGLIDEATAVSERLTPSRFDELLRPGISAETKAATDALTRGVAASPGAAAGRVVFTADRARMWADNGDVTILVRPETSPEDYSGMVASKGILTSSGGANSHAAVVARAEAIPAVCGATDVRIHPSLTRFEVNGATVMQGDWITLDGSDGTVYAGRLPTQPSVLKAALRGDHSAMQTSLWHAHVRFTSFARRA